MARTEILHTTEYAYRNPAGPTRHRMILRLPDVTVTAAPIGRGARPFAR